MTLRLTDYGGTDWSDGEVLADLNSTMKASVIHRKVHTDATERTIEAIYVTDYAED